MVRRSSHCRNCEMRGRDKTKLRKFGVCVAKSAILRFAVVASMSLGALSAHIFTAYIRPKSESIIAGHFIEVDERFP